MKSVLAHLLESENAKEVLGFLRERGAGAHIVAPEWVHKRALGRKQRPPGAPFATWSESAADIRSGAANVLVVAEEFDHEQAVVSALRRHSPAKVFGLFGHVLPALLCSMNGFAAGFPAGNLKRYAILCVPRCGSRYLAAVLSTHGVGAPKEHIREPLARIMADGANGFARGIEALERFGQRNGIFGTKLISTFLLRASHGRMPELTANVEWLAQRGYGLVRLERPLHDSVISSYIAWQMGRWHVFGTLDQDTRAKLDALEFDDGAAWSEYIRFRAENAVVDALARHFDMPTISYAAVESNVDGVVTQLCDTIGVDRASLQAGSARIPIPIRSESRTYDVFSERMASLLERRADDVEGATMRKLRAIGKIPQEMAEEMAASVADKAYS